MNQISSLTPTIKSQESPLFLRCRWRDTYHSKALNKDYNFALDLTSIEGMHTKLWASKVVGVLILGVLEFPLGSPRTKWHLGIENTIRGKVVASSKSESWWVLWVCVYSWFISASKCSNYTLTNLLFGLCRFMWVIDLLVNLPSPHPNAPTRPSTPKVLWAKESAPTFFPSVVFIFGLTIESIKELGGASNNATCNFLTWDHNSINHPIDGYKPFWVKDKMGRLFQQCI